MPGVQATACVLTDDGSQPLCRNGVINPSEVCDDGNIAAGDGCFGCEPEYCYACPGPGPTCAPITACINGDGCCAPGCQPSNDDDCSADCTAAKINCVSKKKSCRFNCYANAAFKGVPVSTACLAKCSSKIDLCFLKQEVKGGCLTVGDTAAIEAKVDAFTIDVVSELDPLPLNDKNNCRKNKLRAVAAYDRCVLARHVVALKKGIELDVTAVAKCAAKFGVDFPKYEPGGNCETVGDRIPIQNKDDAFIADVTCELGDCH